MSYRWTILAVLFAARTAMAFQFQSVAALSPYVIDSFLLTLADIGLLIGLFLGPGILVAIPGSAIAARVGDKRVTVISLGLMLIGAILMAIAPGWEMLIAGRILSGIGGCVINVIMTKMLLDWFADKEIGTAMGVYIGSWPFGIALALLILPPLSAIGGLDFAWAGLGILVALAMVAVVLFYRPPDGLTAVQGPNTRAAFAMSPLLASALIWSVYNAGIAMVFGFGPLLLTQQGLGAVSASSVISVFMLTLGLGVPLGGILSDRSGRRDTVIAISLAVTAICMPLLISVPQSLLMPAYGIVGLVMGIAAGPIMTTPAQVLPPPARAVGMGLFWTVYYAVMMFAPSLAGQIADRFSDASTAYWLGAGGLVFCLLCLGLFRQLAPSASHTT